MTRCATFEQSGSESRDVAANMIVTTRMSSSVVDTAKREGFRIGLHGYVSSGLLLAIATRRSGRTCQAGGTADYEDDGNRSSGPRSGESCRRADGKPVDGRRDVSLRDHQRQRHPCGSQDARRAVLVSTDT